MRSSQKDFEAQGQTNDVLQSAPFDRGNQKESGDAPLVEVVSNWRLRTASELPSRDSGTNDLVRPIAVVWRRDARKPDKLCAK